MKKLTTILCNQAKRYPDDIFGIILLGSYVGSRAPKFMSLLNDKHSAGQMQ